ncbi:ABC transporter ATP-binding protein [Gloeocapsopsis dulcis]|uniref:Helicase n=1 Tax=Gloeocapsopsis dulcis AAB1 = 1H9 TaxID=1433147 RepID=A0A6N8FNJ0_9CHRO|nr:ABC transporter ATP-binding protein [Gloeocapsopsis dulcis]MUL35008.1 helicase [Gloeocapsopsis dulcis AAB1 = 1H9]WNN89917.1 ABC transporter ATP-binding protein [Gloeocapsopsis dulcis]
MNVPIKQYAKLLGSYLKPQQGRVALFAVALLTSIGLQVLSPQILGYFIDTSIAGASGQVLFVAALLFIGAAVLTQLLSVIATYLGENVAWTATNALRADIVEHCIQLDLSFYKSRTSGELLERVDGDVNVLSRFFSQLAIHTLGNGILLVGILVALFFENWLAGVSLTLFSLFALTILLSLHSFAVAPWTTYLQVSAEFFGFIGEHLVGREDIRANGAVSYVMRRFHQILQRWLPVYQKARFTSTILWSTSVGLFTTGNAIALAVSAYLWNQNAITIGSAYLIFHYTNLLNQPIERIREELEELQQVEASIYRIREILQIQSRLSKGGDRPLVQGALSVACEQVWFSYQLAQQTAPNSYLTPQEWTLQDISFYLPAGQVLGLLGRTGSGKTTLARLLLRFYDAQLGCIRLGDVAIAQTPLTTLRQRVGLVTQDVQLFQASVRDNLTFFDSTIPDVQIWQTLELLGLTTWLRSLPEELDTQLDANSGGLSAGQAQLLTFARVFLKNPGLVILDEASSRLDPITEHLIEQAVDRLLDRCTGIIIAHRLQTVQRADQILILDQGRILEYGDRQSLLNNPHSHFSRLLKAGTTDFLV